MSQEEVAALVERHADKIRGVLSCSDRVIITGTIPEICHAKAMASHLSAQKIRLFDYPRWAQPFREAIRKNDFRKEGRVKTIVAERGDHPGLVHIFSAMESCPSFQPWHAKTTHKTFLRSTEAKCLHYYFYVIDEELGLCYPRVPTWAPFRLQFYFNGHNELARRLEKKGIHYTLLDNAFVEVEDFDRAQKLADSIRVAGLHRRLDRMARTFCPGIRQFHSGYHWSLMQTEYATDIVFKRREDLRVLYDTLVRTAVHTVRAEQVAMFLGRKLHGNYLDELGSDFHTRIQGTRIKHHMGKVAIKMYDKHGRILRIKTVANDVGFFKHHREVEQRDGTRPFKLAPVKKTIYSLSVLRELMAASNRRYLDFLSTLDDPTDGAKNLDKVSRPVRKGERTFRGFNLFHGDDLGVFTALLRGEFNISGLTCRRLRAVLKNKSGSQVSRILQRLRMHGLIRKIGRTYKYYLTQLGRRVLLAATLTGAAFAEALPEPSR